MPYEKTQAGQLAFKERSALLSARQRAAFILFDGIKPVEQVLAVTSSLGISRLDVDHMVTHGFLQETNSSSVTATTAGVAPPAVAAARTPVTPVGSPIRSSVSSRTPQERYRQAWPIATQLIATLGLRGFQLNLAIEAASGYDELLALFPKIAAAVGVKQCAALEQALKD